MDIGKVGTCFSSCSLFIQ